MVSSSLQSRDTLDMISIIPVTDEGTFAEELPDIDAPATISIKVDHSNIVTSIVIDLPPAMEEQDDKEDTNVDNVMQTQDMAMAESWQSPQPWIPEMQRRKRKRCL